MGGTELCCVTVNCLQSPGYWLQNAKDERVSPGRATSLGLTQRKQVYNSTSAQVIELVTKLPV